MVSLFKTQTQWTLAELHTFCAKSPLGGNFRPVSPFVGLVPCTVLFRPRWLCDESSWPSRHLPVLQLGATNELDADTVIIRLMTVFRHKMDIINRERARKGHQGQGLSHWVRVRVKDATRRCKINIKGHRLRLRRAAGRQSGVSGKKTHVLTKVMAVPVRTNITVRLIQIGSAVENSRL